VGPDLVDVERAPELLVVAGSDGSERDDVAAQLDAADLAMVADDADGALRRLLDLLTRTSGDERDQVRQRLVDYFELLGSDDERVPPARREMARALF
jgi:putative thioredoxin